MINTLKTILLLLTFLSLNGCQSSITNFNNATEGYAISEKVEKFESKKMNDSEYQNFSDQINEISWNYTYTSDKEKYGIDDSWNVTTDVYEAWGDDCDGYALSISNALIEQGILENKNVKIICNDIHMIAMVQIVNNGNLITMVLESGWNHVINNKNVDTYLNGRIFILNKISVMDNYYRSKQTKGK